MKEITVVRSGAVGDFILTLPAIAALRHTYPTARLRLIGYPPVLSLARPDLVLDQDSPLLIPLHTESELLPSATAALFAQVDLLLAYIVDPDGILTAHLQRLVPGLVLVHDPRPPAGVPLHIIDHLLQPLHQAGIPILDSTPRIQLQEEEYTYANHCWQRHRLRPPTAIVHPGSGGRHKCWPLENYLELTYQLQQHQVHVLVICGPVEADLTTRLPAGIPLLRPPDLWALAGLLARADLFIGNDSGPGHIAAAVGTPTLTLFGPTDPRVWRPRGPTVRVLQARTGQLAHLAVDSVLLAACQILRTARCN